MKKNLLIYLRERLKSFTLEDAIAENYSKEFEKVSR